MKTNILLFFSRINLLTNLTKLQKLFLYCSMLLVVLATAQNLCLAQQSSVQLLKDINTSTNNFSSFPAKFFSIGEVSYFAAFDPLNGTELWRTDGTAGGTVFIKDINPGSGSSFPVPVAAIGSTLYFVANDGSVGSELWKTDGTAAGTVLVKDINPGTESGVFEVSSQFAVFSNELYFTANNSANGGEFWKTDGTLAGTVLVKDIEPGSRASSPRGLTVLDNTLYFVTSISVVSSNNGLWKSDGTSAGTVLVKAGIFDSLEATNSKLYFFKTGLNELWTSDGTADGTIALKTFSGSPNQLTSTTNRVFFDAPDDAAGRELWTSDGTVNGTVLVKDIRAGIQGSLPENFTAVGTKLFFAANDGADMALWVTDGSAAGTIQLNPVNPGTEAASVNNIYYYSGFTDAEGLELWKSDGTVAGTVLVKDIRSGTEDSQPFELASFGDKLIFSADDGISGREPWVSDGTAGGTQLIGDLGGNLNGSNPREFTTLGNIQVFSAFNSASGRELWKTDGTPAGTVLLKDINSGPASSFPDKITAFSNNIFFVANDDVNGTELWKSDGTAAGTVLVKDLTLGAEGTPIREFEVVGSTLYFLASTQLWKSDGTAAGTVLVKTFRPDYRGAEAPRDLTAVGNTLFLAADDGTSSGTGQELWRSDGTEAGTVLVKDISPGLLNWSAPRNLTNFNGVLYFQARNDLSGEGTELWKSDGTAVGTVLVKDINPTGASFPRSLTVAANTLFFVADNGTSGDELWRTDGSPSGTTLVKDVFAGAGSSSPQALTAVGNRLFFSALEQISGRELWSSDGTETGTVLVTDINPGSDGSNIQSMRAIGHSTVVFGASNGISGVELWKSDGTASGTSLVEDIAAGVSSSNPSDFAVFGNKLYFVADNGTVGREPFVATFAVTGNLISLFTTQMPSQLNATFGTGVELGTKFVSTEPGRIVQIRYWKAQSETGTHTGRIWSENGQLLATVNFTNETQSGWQTATLVNPLEILPNQIYTVSVNANSHFAATFGIAKPITNQPLRTTVKRYGVFGAPNTFPRFNFRNGNYFRDIVFQPTLSLPKQKSALAEFE